MSWISGGDNRRSALDEPAADPVAEKLADPKLAMRWVRRRLAVVALVVLALFAAVGYRAYALQIEQGPRLREMAEQQYLKQIEIPARRGTIYDRHRAPLAVSVEVDSVHANPRMIGDRAGAVAKKLAPLLELDEGELRAKLSTRRYFVWLARRIAPDVAAAVRQLKIRGVFLQKESKRYYPHGRLAANVIGFAGLDAKGLEGLEHSLDSWLRGGNVRIAGLRDALGRVLSTSADDHAHAGHDVELSLDRFIQYETERALELAYEQVAERSGWVGAVVLDPRRGDVLAMASMPSFDPNHFGRTSPAAWRNRNITDAFEPGSTLKIFSVAAAMAAGVVSDSERIDCEHGRFRVGRHVIHDSKPYDELSLAEVLSKSSNIGVSKIAARLGRQGLYEALSRFGFGAQTTVPLRGERAGVLRPWRRWSDVGLANIAFGQGVTVTVLQLARALTAIANDGVMMEPRLVLRIRDGEGRTRRVYEPRGERVLPPGLAARMRFLLRGVTRRGGTGVAAALDRYSVAGKTGTAQKVDPAAGGYADDKWVSSFIGVVPAGKPRLAIAVVVNEPAGESHYGGEVAGPVFKRIAARALRYLGVEPDKAASDRRARAARSSVPEATRASGGEEQLAPPLPRATGARGRVRVPDFTGMSMAEALRAAHAAGVRIIPQGSGRATAQSPGPGPGAAGIVCRVAFRPPS